MEEEEEYDSNSQSTFDSLNLNPHLLLNEVYNIFDDCLDDAFSFFLKESSKLLKIGEGTEDYEELAKGVDAVKNVLKLDLDKHFEKCERFCLNHCFRVPDDFTLPKDNEASKDELAVRNFLADTRLDSELKSLHEQIALVGKETAQLARQVDDLEEQSLSNNRFAGSFDEVVQLYRTHNTSQDFQELTTLAPVFRSKLMNLKRKVAEDRELERYEKIHCTSVDMLWKHTEKCFGRKPEEVAEFLDGIVKTNK